MHTSSYLFSSWFGFFFVLEFLVLFEDLDFMNKLSTLNIVYIIMSRSRGVVTISFMLGGNHRSSVRPLLFLFLFVVISAS